MPYTVTLANTLTIPVAYRDLVNDTGSYFGSAAAFDANDRVLVGCPYKYIGGMTCGAVYVFDWDGAVVQEIQPQAVDQVHNAYFGSMLATSGDWLLVGAYAQDVVYFFEWSGGVYVFRQRLAGSTTVPGDNFGEGIAIDGNLAVVGAPNDDDGAVNAGVIFTFRLAAGVWTEDQIIPAPAAQAFAGFGRDVAVEASEGIIAVGAPTFDDGFVDEGRVYILEEALGVFTLSAQFAPAVPAIYERLGRSVAVEGLRIFAGKPGHDHGGAAPVNQGGFEIYEKTGGVWVRTQDIEAPVSAAAHANVGSADVAHKATSADGTLLVVGGYGWQEVVAAGWRGACFLYALVGGTYVYQNTIYPDKTGKWSQNAIDAMNGRLLLGGYNADSPEVPGMFYGEVRLYTVEAPATAYPVKLPSAGLYIDEIRDYDL